MNKGELIERIAKDAKLSKTQATKALNSRSEWGSGDAQEGRQGHPCRFWDLFSREAQGSNGPQPSDGCQPEDSSTQGGEVFARCGPEEGC